MKYLLDTHSILWYAQGSEALSQKALSLMENEDCFYSVASLWEIALKQKLNKLDNSFSVIEIDELCKNAGFIPIQINACQIEKIKTLDFIHRDPFDRLLIAIAQTENLSIITRDTIIPKYDVKTEW